MFRWVLLFFLLDLTAKASNEPEIVPDIFSGPSCAALIASDIAANGAAYRAEGIQLNYSGSALEEFVARKALRRLVRNHAKQAFKERNETGMILTSAVLGSALAMSIVKDFTDGSLPQRKRDKSIGNSIAFFRMIAAETTRDGKTLREKYPFSFSILLERPPIQFFEAHAVEDIVFLRAAMSLYRMRAADEFLKLPMERSLAKLDRDLLEEAHKKTMERIATELIGPSKERDRFQDQAKEIERELAQVNQALKFDFADLGRTLLANNDIPVAVRQEIATQVDFDSTYGFDLNPYLRVYLLRVSRYYDGGTTE